MINLFHLSVSQCHLSQTQGAAILFFHVIRSKPVSKTGLIHNLNHNSLVQVWSKITQKVYDYIKESALKCSQVLQLQHCEHCENVTIKILRELG